MPVALTEHIDRPNVSAIATKRAIPSLPSQHPSGQLRRRLSKQPVSPRLRGPSVAVVEAQAKADQQLLAMQLADKQADRKHQFDCQQLKQEHERALQQAPLPLAIPAQAALPLVITPDSVVQLPLSADREEPASPAITAHPQHEPVVTEEEGWSLGEVLMTGGLVYLGVRVVRALSQPPVARPSLPPAKTLDELANQLSQCSITKPAIGKGNA